MKKLLIGLAVVAVITGIGLWQREVIIRQFLRPTESSVPEAQNTPGSGEVTVVASGLEVPWEVVELPEGDLLVSERPGRLVRIGQDKQIIEIEGVNHVGEGGLLGLALHPNFTENNYLYVYFTTDQGGAGLINRIERYSFADNQLSDKTEILTDIPGARVHDGGRIAFGPDGKLYVTTGDAGNEQLAQDTNSLAGKILRLNDDGSVPSDNPFNNAVYSYGHRNPQGLAWDEQGRLWSSEHGPSGLSSGNDELNLIRAGGNYGWPLIRGDEQRDGMISPVVQSGLNETWAPASLAYANGSLFFAGLRGQTLYEAIIQPDASVELTAHFKERYGRLRTVRAYSDYLYLTTSNQDGRGTPNPGDDKIFKLQLSLFN